MILVLSVVTRLAKSLLRRTICRPGTVARVWSGPLRGLRFMPTSGTGLSPLYSGTERGVQEAISGVLGLGGTSFDIGANWGLHTLLMARLVGPDGHVWAFEPFASAFVELEASVRLNGFTQVVCRPEACGDETGLRWFCPGTSSSTGRLLPDECHSGEAQQTLVVRLDDQPWVGELDRLDLIKIDVEGAESRVLAGAERTLARYRPAVIVELHTPEQDVLVGRFFSERGYTVGRVTDGPPIERLDAGWPTPNGVWGTIFAIPTGGIQ